MLRKVMDLKRLEHEDYNPNWDLLKKARWALSIGRYREALAWSAKCVSEYPSDSHAIQEQVRKECGDRFASELELSKHVTWN